MPDTVGIGMLGTGFIGQFHHQGLRHVAGRPARSPASGAMRSGGTASRLATATPAARLDRRRVRRPRRRPCRSCPCPMSSTSRPFGRRRATARASPAPSRSAGPARRPPSRFGAVTEAGVWHGYLENVVFSAELVRMREMVEAGGIGRRSASGRARPQRPARGPLLGRRDGRRRGAPGHGVARHRGGAVPVRQGARASGMRSPGATRWSTGTARRRGQRRDADALRGWPSRHDGRLVVQQGRPGGPLRAHRHRRPDHLGHGVDRRCGRSSSNPPATLPRRRTRTPAGCSRCPTRRTPTDTTR